MMPIFENSFRLSNYENIYKNEPIEIDKGAKEDKDWDERTTRISKKIDEFSIETEDHSLLMTDDA